MRLLFLLMALACVPRPDVAEIRSCDAQDPTVDCCTSETSCRGWFGDSFRFCEDPGPDTGRCVECQIDEHCDLESYCADDPDHGSWCAPLSALRP